MLKFKASGKTISQAIDAGLKELKVEKNQVEIKVLTKPQNFVLAEVEICVPREVVEKNQHLQNLKKLEVLNAEIHSAEQKLLKSKAEKDSILNHRIIFIYFIVYLKRIGKKRRSCTDS